MTLDSTYYSQLLRMFYSYRSPIDGNILYLAEYALEQQQAAIAGTWMRQNNGQQMLDITTNGKYVRDIPKLPGS